VEPTEEPTEPAEVAEYRCLLHALAFGVENEIALAFARRNLE
jgi:hypothetical protein